MILQILFCIKHYILIILQYSPFRLRKKEKPPKGVGKAEERMTQTQEIVEEEIIILIRGQMEPQCQQEMQGIHKQGK